MSPPATPWSSQPKGLPAKESSGTELAVDRVILTAVTIPSNRLRRNHPDLGMLTGTTIAVVLVLVVGFLLAGRSGDSTPARVAAGTNAPTALAANAVQVNRGLTIGEVTANDGKTLTVAGLLGATTKVHVNADTQVFVLSGTSMSNVKVGAAVVVHGNKEADGSITANLIVGTEL
ncbi:DUF5666 domain-containing protein [Nocardia sp. CA-107356]|uniref:DUF5666 domain-containing protein n=1 Tax=Nocardia sp. CA-107356 TaxID=3239972 RepID=UPI003D915A4F